LAPAAENQSHAQTQAIHQARQTQTNGAPQGHITHMKSSASQPPRLPDLVTAHDRLSEELRKLDLHESEAKAELEAVASDDTLSIAEQEQQLLSVRITLDICPPRRRKLEADLKALDTRIASMLAAERKFAIKAVQDARDEEEAKLRGDIAKWMEEKPDSRQVKRVAEEVPAAFVDVYRRLITSLSNVEHPPLTPAEAARKFLSVAQRVGKTLGWK
jgi:hypothetical protein